MTESTRKKTAIVLSGGGARGAYEAGVVAGVLEVLGVEPKDRSPFDIYAGTSVGAINAAYLAAYSHRGEHNIIELLRMWRSLRIGAHLRVDPLGLIGWPKRPAWMRFRKPKAIEQDLGSRFGRSILDSRELDRLVRDTIPWSCLHDNIRTRRAQALIVAALHVGSGRTTIFGELAPSSSFRASKDPRRIASLKPITANHILASAAIPLLFPARRIEETYYCDGGLRFNTPISPAIRAGADRLLVVSLMHRGPTLNLSPVIARIHEENASEQYPNPFFLAGKLLDALMLDPIMYDLQMLDRINALMESLESTLEVDELKHIHALLTAKRGLPYRRLRTLVFTPSKDIGQMAGLHLRDNLSRYRETNRLLGWLLSLASHPGSTWESDLASYLLFDGTFAEKLIEMGRRDVHRREEDVRAFFA